MGVIELTDATWDEEVKGSDVPVLIDFWAPWCGPCRMIAPILEDLAEEHGDALKVGKLNVDEHSERARSFNVTSIPFCIVVKDGEVVAEMTGAHPRSKFDEVLAQIL